MGILGGCGSSSTASSSHPPSSTSTSTPTQELKGTISEYPLPAHVSPGDITKGSDGNLWFTTDAAIGRITPTGVIRLFSLPATTNSSKPVSAKLTKRYDVPYN
jgi:streptogramin lyase